PLRGFTLFPYTTLFRSDDIDGLAIGSVEIDWLPEAGEQHGRSGYSGNLRMRQGDTFPECRRTEFLAGLQSRQDVLLRNPGPLSSLRRKRLEQMTFILAARIESDVGDSEVIRNMHPYLHQRRFMERSAFISRRQRPVPE